MPRHRDPNFTTGHLCRFCGQLVPWGTILRIIRVDPDTPPYMLNETAAHTECLAQLLRPGVDLTFPRHWAGKGPLPNDDEDIFLPIPSPLQGRGLGRGGASADPPLRPMRPGHRPRQPSQGPSFARIEAPDHDPGMPVHFECLAKVSTMRFG